MLIPPFGNAVYICKHHYWDMSVKYITTEYPLGGECVSSYSWIHQFWIICPCSPAQPIFEARQPCSEHLPRLMLSTSTYSILFLALSYYHPQRRCGTVMFLHLSVSHSVHSEGREVSVRETETPLDRDPPLRETPH